MNKKIKIDNFVVPNFFPVSNLINLQNWLFNLTDGRKKKEERVWLATYDADDKIARKLFENARQRRDKYGRIGSVQGRINNY